MKFTHFFPKEWYQFFFFIEGKKSICKYFFMRKQLLICIQKCQCLHNRVYIF